MFSTWPFVRRSVRPFVCYKSCQHDILKTNTPTLLQLGTSGQRGKADETIDLRIKK